MKCKKCSKEIFSDGLSFCPYCGSYLLANTNTQIILKTKNKKQRKIINKLIYLSLIIVWVAIISVFYVLTKEFYYFNDNEDSVIDSTLDDSSNNALTVPGSGVTSIKHENKYVRSYVNSTNDVYSLIVEDSINQKENCPTEIINIENEIINKYKIKAVNLCEMTPTLANEIKDIVKYIYENYPNQRGYLTNLTLANVGENNYIAAFMPIFVFVTSDTSNTYPIGIKTQIILNAEYFLNEPRFNNTIKHGVSIGYYPPNATRNTTVAHEFGHYLSFRAMVKYYNTNSISYVKNSNANLIFNIYDDFLSGTFSYNIVNYAYSNYLNNYHGNMSFDEFRNSISNYAVAKNKEGNYIHDETIAEAFHDCYLNGNDAKLASQLIMESLKRYL